VGRTAPQPERPQDDRAGVGKVVDGSGGEADDSIPITLSDNGWPGAVTRDPPLGTVLRSSAMPGGAAPNWAFRAVLAGA
jgi:hypothetical protein